MYHNGRSISRHSAGTSLQHLVLYAAWQCYNAWLLLVVGEESLVLLLVVAILLLHVGCLDGVHLSLKSLACSLEVHQLLLACNARHETSEEVLQRDGLCRVSAEELVVQSLYHLSAYLLTYLDTSIVGCLLLVVTGSSTLVETLDELIYICSVNSNTLYEIFLQAVAL